MVRVFCIRSEEGESSASGVREACCDEGLLNQERGRVFC